MAKEIKCEHIFTPILWTEDNGIYGVSDEEVFSELLFLIVKCAECNIQGFMFANNQ